jgi:hypothetical protein
MIELGALLGALIASHMFWVLMIKDRGQDPATAYGGTLLVAPVFGALWGAGITGVIRFVATWAA